MRAAAVSVLVLALVGVAGRAAADDPAECRSVQAVKPPAADLVTPAQAAALKGCDPQALYDGEKGPPDYVKARQCAFAETRNGRTGTDEVFGGQTVLMQIYANGLGVKRNLDYALHIACAVGGSGEEIEGRIARLTALKTKPGKTRFDFCDDATSGVLTGMCSVRDEKLGEAKRQAGLNAQAARIAAPARAAFARLRKAADAFAFAHGGYEVDTSGSARVTFETEAEEEAKSAFDDALQAFLAGKTPAATPAQAKAADDALNAAWKKLRDHGEKVQEFGTVVLSQVVKAQRAWLAYRDAFIAFAKVQAPGKPTDGLFVDLTRDRTKTLSELPQ
jgi:uncharacterized protein YecT (DUF1311 family)